MFLNESAAGSVETSSDVQISATPEALLEAMMDAQSELYNLNMSMIRLEHTAIKNENGLLLEKSIKEYWADFVKWIKGLWAKVVAWFKGIWEKITTYFMSAKSFIEKYGAALKASDLDIKGLEFDVYPNIDVAMPVAALVNAEAAVMAEESKVSRDLTKTLTAEDLRDAVLSKLGGKLGMSVTEIVGRAIFGGQKSRTKEVAKNTLMASVDFLEKLEGIKKAIGDSQKRVNEAFSEAVKNAEALVSAAAEDDKKKMKETMARNKSVVARFLSQVQSAVISSVNTAAGYSLSLCKAALSQDAKNKKTVKKEDSVLAAFGYNG